MDRRAFLKLLGGAAGATAAGLALPNVEPVRRFWQVGRNAPVSGPDDGYLFGVDPGYLERLQAVTLRRGPNSQLVYVGSTEISFDEARFFLRVTPPQERSFAGRIALAEDFVKLGLMTSAEAAAVLARGELQPSRRGQSR